MKEILPTISRGQSIVLTAAFALLVATVFTFSTGAALASEEAGAGIAGTYWIESSESTGTPDITGLEAPNYRIDGSLTVEMSNGENEGAGMAGSYAVESSESTGLPDITLAETDSTYEGSVTVETFHGEEAGVGSAGRYEVEISESTGLPDMTVLK